MLCALLKLTLNFFSFVGPSPSIKKLFLGLSAWDDQPLSVPKITTFLAKSLLKFCVPFPWNATPQPWYTHFCLSEFFTILFAPNKKSFITKFLRGLFGQLSKCKTM